MKRVLAGLVASAVLAFSVGAQAQVKAEAKPKPEVLVYETQVLEGGVVGPSLGNVFTKPAAKFECRIKTRGSFQNELNRSADGL